MEYIIKYKYLGIDELKDETIAFLEKVRKMEEGYRKRYDHKLSTLLCILSCSVMLLLAFW